MLYWYRTPPGVKVGRPPFDAETQRALEAKFPDLTFDWPRLIATPKPPPPDVEHWLERRRLERAANRARIEEPPETPTPPAPEPEVTPPAPEAEVMVLPEGGAVSPPPAMSVPGTVARRRRRRGRRRRSDAIHGVRPAEPQAQVETTPPEADPPLAQAVDRPANGPD